MKRLILLLFIILCLSLSACAGMKPKIDKETKTLLLYQKEDMKIGLGEKKKGVMLKFLYKF